MSILSLDFETCSEADLRKVGASRYAADPSTFVTVAAWAFNDDPVDCVFAARGLKWDDLPVRVRDYIEDGWPVAAWNANFEMAILRSVFGVPVLAKQFRCSMEQALYGGLPGKLETCGPALGLATVKDKNAHALMMKCSKPRAILGTGARTYWTDEPGVLLDLSLYCMGDVEAERAIRDHIPELPRIEVELSTITRASNFRGIRIDLELCRKMIAHAQAKTILLNMRCKALTGGAVSSPGTQGERLLAWFEAQGVQLPDATKGTVLETIETGPDAGLPPDVLAVLNIRRMVAKSSVRKLKTMLAAVEIDERIRGSIAFYGAQRTGRMAGRIIQPQNFPRPTGAPDLLIEGILDDLDGDDLELFHGDLLAAIAVALRGVLIPGPGMVFIAIDLSQIEARITAWLGNATALLDAFRNGDDIYDLTAADLGLPTRQAGKAVVLGLGFGQGFERFVEFARGYGVEITKLESLQIVTAWRDQNPGIVGCWWEIDRAVRNAIAAWSANPTAVALVDVMDKRVSIAVTAAKNGQPLMTIRLPSGRRLFYRNIHLVNDPDRDRDAIVFDGVDQKTNQWGPIRTWGSKLFENIVQAIARDVIFRAARLCDQRVLGLLAFSVHDELVFEVPYRANVNLKAEIQKEVDTPPPWAGDLPLASKVSVLERYGK
jgi:DNA polymerase bacteriophage-type